MSTYGRFIRTKLMILKVIQTGDLCSCYLTNIGRILPGVLILSEQTYRTGTRSP
jgi:hypothetical protein